MATQPPDFIPDEEAPDFIPDESADESFASPNQPVPGHPAERLASGMVKGGLGAINPVNLARAAWELGKLGYRGATSPAETGAEIVSGLRETGAAALGQRGPEAAGEVYGGLLAGGLPVGGTAARATRVLGATEASRAYNVKRALRAPAGSVIARGVEEMAPEINMPVVASARKLAKRMTEARKTAGKAVGTAAAALPESDIPVADVLGRIEPPPGQWVQRGDVLEFVADDPALMSAYRASTRRLEDLGPTVTAQDAIRLKRSAQGAAARGRAYTSERAGLQAKAAEARGQALRQELEALPGPEAKKFTKANRRFEVAATAEEPIVAEAARLSDLPIAGRGVEMLLGRAIPGSGFARQALAGLAGGQLLDSTLFHTASAAIKRRVINAVQSGNLQLATDLLFKSAVAEHMTRRRAAAALAAQGEGVIAP